LTVFGIFQNGNFVSFCDAIQTTVAGTILTVEGNRPTRLSLNFAAERPVAKPIDFAMPFILNTGV